MKKTNVKKKVSPKRVRAKKRVAKKVALPKLRVRALKKIINTMEKKAVAKHQADTEMSDIFIRLSSDQKVTRRELNLAKRHVSRLISSIKDRPISGTPLLSPVGGYSEDVETPVPKVGVPKVGETLVEPLWEEDRKEIDDIIRKTLSEVAEIRKNASDTSV